jgi:aryl-alcohol dehydrogenase-like predicted oxidoreductase
MDRRRIGDRSVFPVGLGEMPLSIEGRPDEERAIRTIHAALAAGVTLIDTADAYSLGGPDTGHGEELVARALASYGADTTDVVVATKGGHLRPGDGGWTVDGRPEYIVQACEASLKRLGVDAIDLYQFHRPDPRVPYADSVGALVELLDAGKIKLAGISNASVGQIDEAQRVLGGRLASVQNEFSPRFRSSEGELRLCGRLGVAFLPWSPLGGIGRAAKLAQRHQAFGEVAAELGVSPQRVTLAWMLAKGEHVVPIPGSSRPETIRDSVAAADLALSPEQLRRLDS